MIQDYKAIFKQAVAKKASDIHIIVGIPHILRVSGNLVRVGVDIEKKDVEEYIKNLLNENQQEELRKMGEIDFSLEIEGAGRFRINIYRQKDTYAIAARTIEGTILPLKDLGLPDAIADLSKLLKGLVLVTGPTGSGKSTTLYSILDDINSENINIVTVEDPVEYTLEGINQVNVNNKSGMTFASGLRSILRQDPDVIMIGEIRDDETAEIAVIFSKGMWILQ